MSGWVSLSYLRKVSSGISRMFVVAVGSTKAFLPGKRPSLARISPKSKRSACVFKVAFVDLSVNFSVNMCKFKIPPHLPPDVSTLSPASSSPAAASGSSSPGWEEGGQGDDGGPGAILASREWHQEDGSPPINQDRASSSFSTFVGSSSCNLPLFPLHVLFFKLRSPYCVAAVKPT